MIEPDDATTEGHELGLHGSVVSDEYDRSIQNFRRIVDEFDRVTALRTPELADGTGTGMGGADDVPALPTPTYRCIVQDPEVVAKRRSQFWDHGRYFEQRFEMERDGHRVTLVLTPVPGVPRIKTWGPYGNGRHGIVDIRPTFGNFIARTEIQDDVSVLSESAAAHRAIERRYAGG